MRRILLLALALIFVRVPASLAKLARVEAAQWTISVDAWVDKTHLKYDTAAWVYSPGPNYKLTLYGIGQPSQTPVAHNVDRFDVILAHEPKSTVFNAGYWGDDPFDPDGLLLVDGVTLHKLWFSKKPQNGDYQLSAVVCINRRSQVTLLDTKFFDSPMTSIKGSCVSAVQTGPTMLTSGVNKIRPTEVARGLDKSVLTVLALDANGTPYVVVFQTPVNLYVAAEFLRGKASRPGHVQISGKESIHATAGLGLWQAVDLGGGEGAACYSEGRRIIGNSFVAMPSALTLKPL